MSDIGMFCRDCASVTSGRCWRHSTTIIATESPGAPWVPDAEREIASLRGALTTARTELADVQKLLQDTGAEMRARWHAITAQQEAIRTLTAERDAARAELEAAKDERDFLRRLCAQVIMVSTLQPGEALAEPIEHAVTDAAMSLRNERDASRAARRAADSESAATMADMGRLRVQLEHAMGENARLCGELDDAARLLSDPGANGRYCGYNAAGAKCPMGGPCWHHLRNAFLARRTLTSTDAGNPEGGPR